jgi:hypothetical protein
MSLLGLGPQQGDRTGDERQVAGSAAQPLSAVATPRHHRLMIELCVIQTIEQMDRSGTRGRQAHSDLAGQLRMRACREGSDLLVPGLGELELVADLVEGAKQPIDRITGIAVHALDAPLGEAVQDELGGVGMACSLRRDWSISSVAYPVRCACHPARRGRCKPTNPKLAVA